MNKPYLAYTGIGSRKAPPEILKKIEEIAIFLAKKGYTLRSGGAEKADEYFELGCDKANGSKEIFLPWKGFNNNKSQLFLWPQEAWAIAESVHPAWENCNVNARCLHARNVCQVLGYQLDSPSLFVVCWTEGGEEVGGTATAIRLAVKNKIPAFNLGAKTGLIKLRKFCKKL